MTVTRWLAVACLVLALAGIATYQVVRPRSTWVDPATHVVDGYWVGPEAGCGAGATEATCWSVETAIAHVAETDPSLVTDRATLTQRAGMFYDRTLLGGRVFCRRPVGSATRCSSSWSCRTVAAGSSGSRVGSSPRRRSRRRCATSPTSARIASATSRGSRTRRSTAEVTGPPDRILRT